jgi:hypothetical protein
MTYDNGVCRSKLLSKPLPSPLPPTLPASEFEIEIEPPNPDSGSSCIPSSRLPSSSAARPDPPPILPAPLYVLRAAGLQHELFLLALILNETLDLVDPTEHISLPTAPWPCQLLQLILPSVEEACVRASPRRLDWVTSVYGNEGEVSCVPADTADNVPELSLVLVLSEDNDICSRGSDCIEFRLVPRRRPNKTSGSLVLVELYSSRGVCITGVK